MSPPSWKSTFGIIATLDELVAADLERNMIDAATDFECID